MIHLNYRDARPIYTQITDGFREQILAGVLQGGDKLPSVRDLAQQLSINPNTIQRAYRELEMQGWIATVPGKGCFVCGVPRMTPKEQQPLLVLPVPHRMHQRATGVGLAAQAKIDAGEHGDAAQLQPNYLRLSQAERERLARENR